MPQMSPMMWTVMLTITTMMIMQMNSMNFFSSMNTKKKIKNKFYMKSWKW